MNIRLCVRFGIVAGGAVGLLVGLLNGTLCCSTPPGQPPVGQLMLAGLIVALIAVLLSAAFVCLVSHLPVQPVFTLALLIGTVVGVLLGPPAYHIANPGLALLACALFGAVLGWFICRILCGTRGAKLEISR